MTMFPPPPPVCHHGDFVWSLHATSTPAGWWCVLRVRTYAGERRVDVPPAELPARLRELAAQVGVDLEQAPA